MHLQFAGEIYRTKGSFAFQQWITYVLRLEGQGGITREGVDQTSTSITNISLPIEDLAAILLYEESLTKSSIFTIIYTDRHFTQTMRKIIENDDISGIQRLIQRLSAAEGISTYELAERSGLHPTTLYAILKKKPSTTRRPVRRETIKALAESLRYRATFDPIRKMVIFEESEEKPPKNDIEELLEGLRGVLLRSKRREFTKDMKERILEVVKVLSQ